MKSPARPLMTQGLALWTYRSSTPIPGFYDATPTPRSEFPELVLLEGRFDGVAMRSRSHLA